MPQEKGKGTGEPGWTPREKGEDAAGVPGAGEQAAGEAGDTRPKGRPSDMREETETAAARIESEDKRR